MKLCDKCGKKYPDEMNFCTSCGSALSDIQNADTKGVSDNPVKPTPPVPPPMPPAEVPKKKSNVLKIIVVTIVVLAVFAALAYSHIKNKATYLRLSPSELFFSKQGGDTRVQLDYDGYIWKVNYVPNWCRVVKSDNSFTIYCTKNYSGADREDYVTISSGKILQQLYVGQYGHATYLKLSESSLKVDKDGGSIDISIDSDGSDFEYSISDGCSIINESDEGFTATFDSNSGSGRYGKIIVRDGDESASISFYQKGICSYCSGVGTVTCWVCSGSGMYYNWYGGYNTTCTNCGGTGRQDCSHCHGTGNE